MLGVLDGDDDRAAFRVDAEQVSLEAALLGDEDFFPDQEELLADLLEELSRAVEDDLTQVGAVSRRSGS